MNFTLEGLHEGEEFQELLSLMNIVTIFPTSTQCICMFITNHTSIDRFTSRNNLNKLLSIQYIKTYNKPRQFPSLIDMIILLILFLKALGFHKVINALYKVSVNKLCSFNKTLQRIFVFLTSAILYTEGSGVSASFRNNGRSK